MHRYRSFIRLVGKGALTALAFAFLLAVMPCIAYAEEGAANASASGALKMYTTYPGVAVDPGVSSNFNVSFDNNSAEDMVLSLSVAEAPAGWTLYFEGNAHRIKQVYCAAHSSTSVSLYVTPAADAVPGDYPVTVHAESGMGVSQELSIQYTVEDATFARGGFWAQYYKLTGSSTTEFAFMLNLDNNSSEIQTYTLNAAVPTGWTITFTPAYKDTQVSSMNVDANSNQIITATVKPPSSVKAGEYVIPVTAASTFETLTSELSVTISGTYELYLSTVSGKLNVSTNVGRQVAVPITIANMGSLDITNLTLGAVYQEGWVVEFSENALDVVPAGSTKEVVVYITPGSSAVAGDYVVRIGATSAEASEIMELRTTVETSLVWGIVGVALILVLLIGIAWIFRRFGRR